jgi:RAB protein geranylgeranyltransferase component A
MSKKEDMEKEDVKRIFNWVRKHIEEHSVDGMYPISQKQIDKCRETLKLAKAERIAEGLDCSGIDELEKSFNAMIEGSIQ